MKNRLSSFWGVPEKEEKTTSKESFLVGLRRGGVLCCFLYLWGPSKNNNKDGCPFFGTGHPNEFESTHLEEQKPWRRDVCYAPTQKWGKRPCRLHSIYQGSAIGFPVGLAHCMFLGRFLHFLVKGRKENHLRSAMLTTGLEIASSAS